MPIIDRFASGSTLLALGLVSLAACDRLADAPAAPRALTATADRVSQLRDLPNAAPLPPRPVAVVTNSTPVFGWGFGSAMAVAPDRAGDFYLLTDRGPNIDGTTSDAKIFPVPAFSPLIGRFRLENGGMTLVSTISLRTANGTPITGLPIPPGPGNTGEIPLNLDGAPLGFDPDGIDSEGLVALGDGTFWVSDEYGPFVAHFDATGRQIERVSPFSAGRKLPAVFAKRRANRGMEGLTVLPDGKTLVGIMQSPLDNPKAAGRVSRLTRIVTFDTRAGDTHQYVYVLDRTSASNSEIAAITQNALLVDERDGDFPNDPASPSTLKRIYKIDLHGATDVSDPDDGAAGRLFGGKTLEQLTPADLQAFGIVPASKVLVADLLDPAIGYRHDKAEGLAVIDQFTIAVSNDDDFGINGTDGLVIPKLIPGTTVTDFTEVVFVKLPRPLASY